MVAVLFAGLLVAPGPAQATATNCTKVGPGFNVEAENYPLPPTISGYYYYQCSGGNVPLDIVIENSPIAPVTWTLVANGAGYVCVACRGTSPMLWRINGGPEWRIACNY
jgi:hypothetical protein